METLGEKITAPGLESDPEKCVYQYAMQVGGVDHITDSFDAFYEFAEVGHHILPLNDFGIAREGRWQQSLIYQGLKAHHDRVVCGTQEKKVNIGHIVQLYKVIFHKRLFQIKV